MAPDSLVVDANIVVAALLKDSTSRRLLLRARKIKLYTPEFINEELSKYLGEFSKRLKVKEAELKLAIEQLILASKMEVIPLHEYAEFISEAREITPDVKDAEYFALALKLGCPLWSQDSKLKKQSKVEVLSTKELLEKIP